MGAFWKEKQATQLILNSIFALSPILQILHQEFAT
jgi:hypothetical protein